MVSKRQKLAKKQYKEAHPELFPDPAPAEPRDPNKKKKKKSNKLKPKKSGADDPNKPKKSSSKKHPLRVAGMKPGESCFICRAPDHIAKLCPMKSEWERNKICLSCRQRGHSLRNCPNNENDNSTDKKFCYNCGDMGHSLARCPQPLQDGGTKYANCFICNETGHLSKDCPKNTHGIYPKGGSCKICGGITHLARDCPNKRNGAGFVRQSFDASYERPNRITKLVSGDDLEDDFLVPKEEKEGNEDNVKTKKKQGPKVVNFVA